MLALTLVLAIGLALVGCTPGVGDDPVPTSAPSPTPEPTTEPETEEPTDEPTPWPEPSRPPEMERDDIEGAKAAAVYFVELYTFVYITGDLREWTLISHSACQFCAGVADRAAEVHANGGYADGPVIEIVSVEGEAPDDDYEYYSVWMEVVEHRSSRFDSSGAVINTTDGGSSGFDLALVPTAEGWQIRGATVQDRTSEGGENEGD